MITSVFCDDEILTNKISTIEVGYTLNITTPGHFFLVEQLSDGNWIAKKSSREPILGRSSKSEEIIFVDQHANYAQPYFEKVSYYTKGIQKASFECSPIIDDKESYTPCNSLLTSNNVGASIGKNIIAAITTLGLAAGTHKYVDPEKVRKVLLQKSVFEEIKKAYEEDTQEARKKLEVIEAKKQMDEDKKLYLKKCDQIAKDSELFKNSIRFVPNVIDKSGYFTGEEIIGINEFLYDNSNCNASKEDIKYNIYIKPYDHLYDAVAQPSKYELQYKEGGYELRPTVRITSKIFKQVFPGGRYEDSNISITLNKIKLTTSDKIDFEINVLNKSQKYITLSHISFYINGTIITPSLLAIELPPKGLKSNVELTATRMTYTGELFDNAAKALIIKTSRSAASSKSINFGISAKYSADNVTKSVYQSKSYRLSYVLKN